MKFAYTPVIWTEEFCNIQDRFARITTYCTHLRESKHMRDVADHIRNRAANIINDSSYEECKKRLDSIERLLEQLTKYEKGDYRFGRVEDLLKSVAELNQKNASDPKVWIPLRKKARQILE